MRAGPPIVPFWRSALCAALLLLAACTTRLAPDFDRTVVDGLAQANQDAMTLFASVSAGTEPVTFDRRGDSYNAVIGRFDALRIQAGTRPVPRPRAAGLLARTFDSGGADGGAAGGGETAVLDAPTPEILATVVRTLSQMRDSDAAQGLSPMVVQGFKQEYEISIDQALTYEKALER